MKKEMKHSCLFKKFKQMSWTFAAQPVQIHYLASGCQWRGNLDNLDSANKIISADSHYDLSSQSAITVTPLHKHKCSTTWWRTVFIWFCPPQFFSSSTDVWTVLASCRRGCRAGQWMHQQRETTSHDSAVNTSLALFPPFLFPHTF